MSKNLHTGDNMITKPSSTYSDNFDSIFRRDKLIYAIEYFDGFQDYKTFNSVGDAMKYYEEYKESIVTFEKQQLLLED